MYLIAHTSLSLVIGATTTNPVWAFILAFLAHFVLDAIPHDSKKMYLWQQNLSLKKVNKILFLIEVIEFILIFCLLLSLYFQQKLILSWTMLAAIIGGVLPDVIWGINNLTHKKIKILNKYHQWHATVDNKFLLKYFLMPVYGEVLVHLIVVVFFLSLYLYFF